VTLVDDALQRALGPFVVIYTKRDPRVEARA
jgi:hypothetical protein